MLKSLALKNVGPAPRMSLAPVAPRINLITGDNGLGKTFLLDVAWFVHTQTWPSLPALPRPDTPVADADSAVGGDRYLEATLTASFQPQRSYTYKFLRREQRWVPLTSGASGQGIDRFKDSPHPGDGLVLYARADGGFSVWDATRNPGRAAASPRDNPAAFHFDARQIWEGLELRDPATGDRRVLCSGLIADWVLWQGRNDKSFQQLTSILKVLSPSSEEPLRPGPPARISIEDNRDFPTLHMQYGLDVPVVHASAGMKRILTMAYLLVWAWQEHIAASRLLRRPVRQKILFLIDEIEAHLHPRWQRTILRALIEVMSALTGADDVPVQLIAATHSPLVLASMEPLFTPDQDALWLLDLEDGQASLQKASWAPRGDANRWLTSEAFDLKRATSVEAEAAIEKARTLLRQSSPNPSLIKSVDQELGRLLPAMDPFFVRWRYFLHQNGQGAA